MAKHTPTPFDETITNFDIVHQSLFEFPDIADIGPVLMKSILYEQDLMDNLLIKILGGKSRNTIKQFGNRLSHRAYPPGWPEVSWSMGEEPPDENGGSGGGSGGSGGGSGGGGDKDGDGDWENPRGADHGKVSFHFGSKTEKKLDAKFQQMEASGDEPIMEVPEWMIRAFPALPLMMTDITYDQKEFPIKRRYVRMMASLVGVDTDKLLDAILDSDTMKENPGAVNNLYVSFHVKLWDMAEPAKHYLFDFFSKTAMFMEETGNASQRADTRSIDGKWRPPHKPFKKKHTATPYEDGGGYEGEEVEGSMYGVFLQDDYFKSTIQFNGLEFAEFNMDALDAIPDLKTIYYSNQDKFHADGVTLKEEYYASTGDLYISTGYVAHTKAQIEGFIKNYRCPRAKPLVSDDHKYRWALRVNSPVKFKTFVTDAAGGVSEVDRLLPGHVYAVADDGSLYMEEACLSALIESGELTQIAYYRIHKDGIDMVNVLYPLGGMYINDTETDRFDATYVFGLDHPFAIAAPFFPDLVMEYKNYEAADAFYTSLQASILVSDVVYVDTPWWHTLIKVIALVIVAVVSYVSGFTLAQAIFAVMKALLVMIALTIATKIIMALFDNALLATILVVVISVVSGQYNNIANLAQNLAVNLPQLLAEFSNLMSTLYAGYVQSGVQGLQEEYLAFMDEQQDKENALIMSAGLGSSMDISILLDQPEETSYTEAVMFIVDPATYLKGFENFTSMGVDLLAQERIFDQTLQAKQII
jgi:hypothetical protein